MRRRGLSMHMDSDTTRRKESVFELKELLNYLKYEWPQCLQENPNPIELAVALLDDTSVGLSHKQGEFEEVTENSQMALRKMVNEHYEAFNNSVGSYHLLVNSVQDNQRAAVEIRDMLESTSREIHDKSDSLNELNQTSARYMEMVEVLDAMDELNKIPDKIENLILDKKIHHVYDVIASGYALANKYNLWSLNCMATIKTYLATQSNNLFDMIVDELQNEIYIKAPVLLTDNKTPWEAFASTTNPKLSSLNTLITKSNNLEQYIYNSANLDINEIADAACESIDVFLNEHLPKLIEESNRDKKARLEGHNPNSIKYSLLLPSVDGITMSYHYIYQLLNTAFRLNRLTPTLEILTNTNQQEIHGLIYRTIEATKSRSLGNLAKLKKLVDLDDSMSIGNMTGDSLNEYSVKVLKDLFSSIFLKCMVVLEKQKIVNEIYLKIEENESLGSSKSDSKVFDFQSNWNVMKNELQNLILRYIHKDIIQKDLVPSSGTKSFKDSFKAKELFKFDNVSYHKHNEEMKTAVENMFPGLFENFKNDHEESVSPYIKNESFQTNIEVLVPANVFNMRVILEFFLVFTACSTKIFTRSNKDPKKPAPKNNTALNFFNAFMRLTFLPKLRDNFDAIFNIYIGGSYFNAANPLLTNGSSNGDELDLESAAGFKTELMTLSSAKEGISSVSTLIYRNAYDFKSMFLTLCSILNTSFTYRNDLSDLVLQFLEKFSLTYQQFYGNLLSGSNNSQLNAWLKTPALNDLSSVIVSKQLSEKDSLSLIDKEVQIMLLKEDLFESITKEYFLDDSTIDQINYLLLTTNWILSWLPALKKESNYKIYEEDLSTIDQLKHDWNFLENGRILKDDNANSNTDDISLNIYLSLNSQKIQQFDEIVEAFEKIKYNSLIILRYDIRLKAMYYVAKSFMNTDWVLSSEPGDSDQYISKFNKELFSIENKLHNYLNRAEMNKILMGLAGFLNELIIKASKLIKQINNNGIKKVLINIFTLSQMLKNLNYSSDRASNAQIVSFERSSTYFSLFTSNEIKFLQSVEENKYHYSLKDIQNLVRLIYSEKLSNPDSSFSSNKYNELISKVQRAFA